jgi:phosphodiester glycosidase/flagellar hook capping protein FlgD
MTLRSRLRLLAAASSLATAGLLAADAHAASTVLWPGVTHARTVTFTNHGPVVLNVIAGPRPGGVTTLEPLLSNDTVLGRETVSSMQRRVTDGVTAGVNADFSRFDNGRVSGVFMRHGDLTASPNARRSSVGVFTDGTLDVRKVGLRATWTGTIAHPLAALNDPAPAGGAALYTSGYGKATPAVPGATAAVLFPFPLVTPGVDLTANVVEVVPGGAPIVVPLGGAVLVASGAQGATLATEAIVGSTLRTRFEFVPGWPGVADAVGGGPELVRDGKAVVSPNEWFTPLQLRPRSPRSAVGQLRNGRIILVAVDGRQPGYSTGLTNAELARTMVRLGAVRAMGFDGGGSTTLAFDGAVLNRPSDGRERAVGSALVFHYVGAFLPPPVPQVSPNGDGVGDTQALSYRLSEPSTVDVTLTRPDGSVAVTETGAREMGSHPVDFPPPDEAGSADAGVAEGLWRLRIAATDDLGRPSTMTRTFVVDTTLGFLRSPGRRAVPPGGREIPISWRLARDARMSVTVHDAAGRVVRRGLAGSGPWPAGEHRVVWDGLDQRRQRLQGTYEIRVAATTTLGRSELARTIVMTKARLPRR